MSQELIRAIREIADTSPLARKIVNRNFSGFESLAAAGDEVETEAVDALIKRLLETIEYQAKLIDKLSQHVTLPHDPEGVKNFKQANAGTPIPMLITLYNRQALEQYSKNTRFLIVTALMELAKETNKKPSDLWVKLFANNGEFGD